MHIVLVDDNEIDIFVNQKLIETTGVEVQIDAFLNPKDGLSKLTSSDVDLLIVDNQMPELTGYQFIEKLIDVKKDSLPKIIVLTATVNEKLEQEYTSLHPAIQLWEKPLDVSELTTLLG